MKANNDLPSEFMDYFKTNIDIHSHNTRNAKLLHISTIRTNYGKHTIRNKGIKIWNNISDPLKNTKSFNKFKSEYKKNLLQGCDSTLF